MVGTPIVQKSHPVRCFRSTNQFIMLQEIYIQAEGEEQLVFFKERAADVDIEGVSKVIFEKPQSASIKKNN